MRAAVFEGFGQPMSVETFADPVCPDDGVIVKVMACGVCRSDWHAWAGTRPGIALPHVGGHEFAGVVAEVGKDVRLFKAGDRVTAPFILSCGVCPDCRAGEATICEFQSVIGFTQWGAFANLAAIPHADFNLVVLPEELDYAPAAAMGCRLTTAYRAIVERARAREGEWLAIHGSGGVGLSAVMIGKALGLKVLALDVNAQALDMAKELGADQVLDVSGIEDVGTAVRDTTGGGAHVSLDALGITDTFYNSVGGLRKLGRHVQIGMPAGKHGHIDLPLFDIVYMRQVAIMGTRGMAAAGFAPLIQLVTSGQVDPMKLVTRRGRLTDVGGFIAAMNDYGGHGIAVIDPQT